MSLFTNLGTLESAGLIQVAKVEPDLEYLFRHSLVQDAAYASLIDNDRKRLHLAVGDAIEMLYPDRKRELAAMLGHHFKEAGQDERALNYFILAGDEALSVYANQEAEFQYRQAMELACCSGTEIAWLYSGLGEALFRQSRWDESIQAIRTGIEIYASLGDQDGVARLYARFGRVKWFAYDRPEGLRVCLEGLELVRDAPDSVGKASLMHETARAYYFNGMSDKALPLCRQALALAEQLGAVNVQADSLATLGILAGISSQESLEALRKSVDLAEEHKLLQIAMRAHQNLGTMIRTWLADNETALEHFHRAAELGKMRGSASEEMLGLLSYIACLFAPGRLKEIEAEIPHLEELTREISDPTPPLTTIRFITGLLRGFKGEWDEAITILKECLETWIHLQNVESEVSVLDQITWMLLEKNRWGGIIDFNGVESLIQRAMQIVEQDDSLAKMWVYLRMSVLRARQGQQQDAHQWLEKTRQAMKVRPSAWDDIFELECIVEIARAEYDWNQALAAIKKLASIEKRFGFTVHWARSLICWADIHLNKGTPADLEKAQTLLNQTLEALNEMGVYYYSKIAEDKLQGIQNRLHAQAIDAELLTKELKKARQVQESLLPDKPPKIYGWDLAVSLEPAHETSGDFYDFLSLKDGRLGLVIADVTDKGTSAALFMALSRSLWRTFAIDHPDEPELTMAETNRRILADTHGGLFITLFYGILNPEDGSFSYCSAGHHPAFLIRAKDGSVEQLERTGIPLGAYDDVSWDKASVKLEPGDALVLYTDGITDAQNPAEEFFGLERLQELLKTQTGKPAGELHKTILGEVHNWMGDAPQFDDITLLVVVRDK